LAELTPTVRSAGDTATLVSVKIKLPNRQKVLETLGKHPGLGDRSLYQPEDTLPDAIARIVQKDRAAPIATPAQRHK
jgi:hypothetical protein